MKINFNDMTIELTAKDSKAAGIYGSDAYKELLAARKDFPDYRVVVVKAASRKAYYKGLDFHFMENYIKSHDETNAATNLEELYKMSGRNSNGEIDEDAFYESFGTIKAWFLKKYPAVKGKHIRATKKKAESTENSTNEIAA